MTNPTSYAPFLSAIVMVISSVAVGCSGDTGAAPTPAQSPVSQAPPPLPAGLPDRLQVLMASTDLAVGNNRVAFGIVRHGKGALKDAEVEVQTFVLTDDGDASGPVQTATAAFHQWPGGTVGVYVVNLDFGQAGEWGLRIETLFSDGSSAQAGTRVMVKETSSTPTKGSPSPRSDNRTARDVTNLADLTTDPNPDHDLYQKTIAEALDDRIPLIVSFGTPAFCRTATCGPQLEVVKRLKDRHAGRMNFVHVEVYDNPPEIRERGIEVARLSPTLAEWGLPTEPWTFVVDRDGIIRAKYEGFVNLDELEGAIDEVRQ